MTYLKIECSPVPITLIIIYATINILSLQLLKTSFRQSSVEGDVGSYLSNCETFWELTFSLF